MKEILSRQSSWVDVLAVLHTLKENGHTAWLAGGCVRDALLGNTAADLDVVTSALPDQVEALFPKTVAVGKQFGIIRVLIGPSEIEVATFRSDGVYTDGRHPQNVVFSSPEEDALRRDFTVNAMFYDPFADEVKDFVGGRADLKLKSLRAVGEPERRFEEDRLRMLRAVRFVSQLGFSIEEKTWTAICLKAGRIHVVSRERLRDELMKLLKGPFRSEGLRLFAESGLVRAFPEAIQAACAEPRALARVSAAGATAQDSKGILALLLLDQYEKEQVEAAESVENTLEDLKFSRAFGDELMRVLKSTLLLRKNVNMSKAAIRELLADPLWPVIDRVAQVLVRVNEIPAAQLQSFQESPWAGQRLPHALVTAKSLMLAGMKPGPEMGVVLKEAYQAQLNDEIRDTEGATRWISLRLKL
jgi:tRNA nucleotidyltransferase/poly(A) polymerase